jgi:hypothetical protein
VLAIAQKAIVRVHYQIVKEQTGVARTCHPGDSANTIDSFQMVNTVGNQIPKKICSDPDRCKTGRNIRPFIRGRQSVDHSLPDPRKLPPLRFHSYS